MNKLIKKIRLCNFKRFRFFEFDPNNDINLIVGANESGKSSLLAAINLVISASHYQIESAGLDTVINQQAVRGFLEKYKKKEATLSDLPEVFVELYLNEQKNPNLNGKNNHSRDECDGLRLLIEADDDFHDDIKVCLDSETPEFPYEYYKISFRTFAYRSYSRRNKYLSGILVDESSTNDTVAISRFVQGLYMSSISDNERMVNRSIYRKERNRFAKERLENIGTNGRGQFAIKTNLRDDLETSLTIVDENLVNLDNKGKGERAMIKIGNALKEQGKTPAVDLDTIMIEEPENHLSHTKMRLVMEDIRKNSGSNKQLFITTHSSLIASSLNIQKCVAPPLDQSGEPLVMGDLDKDTARFFMKAPNTNILEMILSPRVILVEGPSEYILMEKMFLASIGANPEEKNVHIISVGGITFKRYLDVAKFIKTKVAVITDNDGNPTENCEHRYSDYKTLENVKVFYSKDKGVKNFEEAIHRKNKKACDSITDKPSEEILDYMHKNKTESAYRLANSGISISTPNYIEEAINWIAS